MSKKQIKIKENIMEKIHENKISMKPKSYFVLGSVLTFIGLIASFISSVFLISIISFLLRTHGPMVNYRLSLMIDSFPLWIPVLALFGLISGIFILKKYDFSYKTSFWHIILAFLLIVIISGFVIDLMGFDKFWVNQPQMKGMMRQYLQKNNLENSDRLNKPYGGRNLYQNSGYGKMNK